MERKGLDRCFMEYGIRKNDMTIIEQVCADHGVETSWFEEFVLKAYQERKNNNVQMSDRKEVESLLKQALKKI